MSNNENIRVDAYCNNCNAFICDQLITHEETCDKCGCSVEYLSDDLTDDEWIIREKHKDILNFAEWFKASYWSFFDNTERGNVYANSLVTDKLLTIEDIYEHYIKIIKQRK